MLEAIGMFWESLRSLFGALHEVCATVEVVASIAHKEATGLDQVMAADRDARLQARLAKLLPSE